MQIIILLFLIFSFGLFLLRNKFQPFLIAALQLSVFLFFLFQIPLIKTTGQINQFFSWIPDLGINISFTLDGLSLIFALLISSIGFLVFLYSMAYMVGYKSTARFNFYLTLFSGAMLGLVLSSNFIQLFIFWELTSVLSFLLISFFHEKVPSREAAFQSLFITGIGGLFLLAGIILIGSIVGSYELKDWIDNANLIKSDNKYLPALILILIGVFTKSAQFPFHFWLPGAMQAPTPVSAYLHSATMVKAGVFLLARLNPVLGGTEAWSTIIPFIGAITMLTGAYLAITQTDLKAILAYTTISALGILVLLFGIDTKLSVKAALVFLIVHAFYKAALFMLAGFIDKKTGTRNIDKLGRLIHFMPIGFIVGSVALFSMAGLPPLLGFIGKELIYEAKVQSPGLGYFILIFGVASNILMVAVSLFLLSKAFLGKIQPDIKHLIPYSPLLLLGPGILAIFSLGFGLFPGFLTRLIEPALNLIRTENYVIHLKLWHGFNQVFLLSLFTVFCGFIIAYIIIKKPVVMHTWRKFNNKIFYVQFSRVFARVIDNFIQFSGNNTKIIQHGYHRIYIMTIILFTALLLWLQIYITKGWKLDINFSLKPFYISGLIGMSIISTLYVAVARSRINAIIAMGVTGYTTALLYLYYSAVDLAITQIIVETITIVMFMIILQKLPRFAVLSNRLTRLRDAGIALAFGGVMTVLGLKAIHVNLNHPISDYYVNNSYLKAFGKNVVNVILVDFRALDTLGEITVLTIAAMGVFVLLGIKRRKK